MKLIGRLVSALIGAARDIKTYCRVFGAAGFWAWIRAKILSSKDLVQVVVPQHPLSRVWLRLGTSDIEVYKKVFIDVEYQLPFDQAPETIVDLGANIGLASVYYALTFPGARVIAVEPSHENFGVLRKNVAAFDKVVCLEAAAWSENCELNLKDPGIGPWGLRVEREAALESGLLVKGLTVSSLMESHGISGIGLLKVDIEGAEKEVFEASGDWIGKVDAIVVELHDRYKAGCSRAFFKAVAGLPLEKWAGENVFVWSRA